MEIMERTIFIWMGPFIWMGLSHIRERGVVGARGKRARKIVPEMADKDSQCR